MSSFDVRHILIPVDFSAVAHNESERPSSAVAAGDGYVDVGAHSRMAIRVAASLSPTATLHLFHVTPPLDYRTIYGPAVGSALIGNAVDELHARTRAASLMVLEAVGEQEAPGRAIATSCRPGLPVAEILNESQRIGCDLIVLAASGRSRVARFVMGSTADQIIRQATCPVVVVPTAALADND